MARAFLLGIAASAFFAFTFLLNRTMNLAGGSWMYSASLRFLFMLPLLLGLVALRRGLAPVRQALTARPLAWLCWSTLGFGVFYAFVCLASLYGPSWLIAGTWQITIVMGALAAPFLAGTTGNPGREHHDHRARAMLWNLRYSFLILAGIAFIQIPQAQQGIQGLASIPFILIAALAYPIGNRKTMELSAGTLDTPQRVLTMTLASLPFWLVLFFLAWVQSGPPQAGQLVQSALVALCSGFIATLLFFKATDLVKDQPRQLALVESTQSGEIVFTLLGGLLVLGDTLPGGVEIAGLILVCAGMAANSILGSRPVQSQA